MKKRRIMIVVFLLCILTGCKNDDKITLVEKDSEIQGEATITEDESEEEPKDNTEEEDWEQPPIAVRDRETMSKVLEENIEKCEQPPAMELSDFPVEYGLENDVKNVFSQLISVRSDLQYAYNITSEIKEDGLVQCQICNGIFNHTSLCEFYQGKLLLHLTIPFEEKPKTNAPSDNLRYYRQRKQMTTRQLAEKLDIVPATVVMYENGKHPIPYDVAIKLADVLEIEASLLYDDFSRFLAVPYTEALKSVRTALGLSQKAFAEQMEIVPSYYYKLEEGNRRPSRKVYQKICAALEATDLQTSFLWEHPLQ